MLLTIADRLTVQDILPPSGDIVTIKIVRDLRDALGFTEAEIAESGIVGPGEEYADGDGNKHIVGQGQIHWDKEIEKEIEIGPKALSIIVNALEQLNKDGKLTLAHLPVYEKFVEGA